MHPLPVALPPAAGGGLLALLLCMSPAAAADWPAVPVPAGARGEVVTRHMLYNGIDMRASQFQVKQPLSEVKAFYRGEWGKRLTDTPLGNKHVLGHLAKGHFITVELAAAGETSTRGQIGVMKIPDTLPDADAIGRGFARLPNTTVVEDIVYLDTPGKVRTLNLVNRYSPFQNAQFYSRRYKGQGYAQEPDAAPCVAASRKCLLRYSKGEARVMVSAIQDRKLGTVIVAVVE